MLDAIVQFLRNGLCCIKDLGLLQGTFLWDNHVTMEYYDLPEPFNKTTPLEVLISIFQAYALWSASTSGYSLVVNSVGKLTRIRRLQQNHVMAGDNAGRLVQDSLRKEAKFAIRSILIGFLVFLIGLSFLWLTANSWHVTETMLIGGLPGLIYSLSVNELCLFILLIYMFKDGREQLSRAQRMLDLVELLKGSKPWKNTSGVNLSSFEALTGWLPFWDSGVHPLEAVDQANEGKLMAAELAKVNAMLQDLTKQSKRAEIAEELQVDVKVARLEGYREFVYLIINAVAFYGYLLGILVYFFPDDDESTPPTAIRYMMFQWSHDLADWRGNFAGDFCWTIEPMIILASPIYLTHLRESHKRMKVKSD